MTKEQIWLWLHNLWSPCRDQILWNLLTIEQRHEYLSFEGLSIANLMAVIFWDHPTFCDWEYKSWKTLSSSSSKSSGGSGLQLFAK